MGLWRGGQSTVRFTINVITPNPKNLDSFIKHVYDRAKLKASLITFTDTFSLPQEAPQHLKSSGTLICFHTMLSFGLRAYVIKGIV